MFNVISVGLYQAVAIYDFIMSNGQRKYSHIVVNKMVIVVDLKNY